MNNEVDVHIWCEPETEGLSALYTVSVGKRLICRALPKEDALEYIGELLDDMNNAAKKE